MSLKKHLDNLVKAVEWLGKNSSRPEAADVVRKTLVILQEVRHVMGELLHECPRCNGARGAIGRDAKDHVTYTPCPLCRGLGVLCREGLQ